ncbi:hypothetical protein [Mesobacillus subterraneus]|uniref:hypothetical protein n=1 Tax=Mesobacillus subterraneus TaxID=285983 RepID=UPI000FFEB808|nr:hypothetical protein [Mesobacillus subterraneus]
MKLFIWMVIGSVAIGLGLSEATRRLASCSTESECLEQKSIILQNKKGPGGFCPVFLPTLLIKRLIKTAF